MAALPLNDALNRPKLKLGIDWRVLLAISALAALTAIFVNIVLGMVLLFALPPVVHRVTKRDPQLFRLWALSYLQRAYYDPGKAVR